MDGLDGVYRDPNGSAHQVRESRVGPPLEYVAEKLASTLSDLHRAFSALADDASGARRGVVAGFTHALVAWLALGNMLALAEDPAALAGRLLALPSHEFEEWRWRVGQGASVTG
jgi:hypothetical protein